MGSLVFQKWQEQKLDRKSASHLQVWHSGRFLGVSVFPLSYIDSPLFSYNKAWKFEWQMMMGLTWHHFLSLLRLYNHIQQPSKLGFGCDYCLFKVRWASVCVYGQTETRGWLLTKHFTAKQVHFWISEHHSVTAYLIICMLIKRWMSALSKNNKTLIYIFFCMSQDGIKPMWEDDRNKLGGRWLMTLSKQQRHNDLDRYWMETVRLTFLLTFSHGLLDSSVCDCQLHTDLSVVFAAVVFNWRVLWWSQWRRVWSCGQCQAKGR